jgi:hypothetical protein
VCWLVSISLILPELEHSWPSYTACRGFRVSTEELEGKHKIIQAHHDPPVHGHPGINKMMQIVEHNYWWPQMCHDITNYVQGCADCQCHKVNNRPTKAPLRPIYPKPEAMPFKTIALDFITKLPESQGYDSILTITDHNCTKAAIFIPCREEINAEGTAALYIQHVFAHFCNGLLTVCPTWTTWCGLQHVTGVLGH